MPGERLDATDESLFFYGKDSAESALDRPIPNSAALGTTLATFLTPYALEVDKSKQPIPAAVSTEVAAALKFTAPYEDRPSYDDDAPQPSIRPFTPYEDQ